MVNAVGIRGKELTELPRYKYSQTVLRCDLRPTLKEAASVGRKSSVLSSERINKKPHSRAPGTTLL